jgi:uracil-DNA glycosylase
MWRTLQSLAVLPLLWNAFPFHPHRTGQPLSNRRPARRELDIGAVYLIQLLGIFKPERVVAVGNCAAESLARLGIFHYKVRHPSHGGKQAFMAQLRAFLSDTPDRNIRVDL